MFHVTGWPDLGTFDYPHRRSDVIDVGMNCLHAENRKELIVELLQDISVQIYLARIGVFI